VKLFFLFTISLCAACSGSQDVQLAFPSRGFQLATEAFQAPASAEVQRCYFFRVPAGPAGTAAAVWVGRIVAAQNSGSHPLNVFRVKTVVGLDGEDGAVVDGGECWRSGSWADWPLVMNSQQSLPRENTVDWTLPTGVAHKFMPGEKLMLQTHYVNASSQRTPGRGKGVVDFYAEEPSPSLAELGTVFATDQNLRICPGDTNKAFSATCRFARAPVTIIGANGHFHPRGVKFEIGTVDSNNHALGNFYTSTS